MPPNNLTPNKSTHQNVILIGGYRDFLNFILRIIINLIPFIRDIFLTGGFNKDNGILQTVEKYHLKNDIWELITSMNIPRSSHGCIVYNGKLSVLGGLSQKDGERKTVKSVELFDFEKKSWNFSFDLPTKLCDFNVVSFKNNLLCTTF